MSVAHFAGTGRFKSGRSQNVPAEGVWLTLQAHAERLLAMQQLIRPSALAEVPRLANADQTLGLLLDAAATASTCPAEQSDSTGGVLQVSRGIR